jgi:hypothetical protein
MATKWPERATASTLDPVGDGAMRRLNLVKSRTSRPLNRPGMVARMVNDCQSRQSIDGQCLMNRQCISIKPSGGIEMDASAPGDCGAAAGLERLNSQATLHGRVSDEPGRADRRQPEHWRAIANSAHGQWSDHSN